MLGKKSLTTGAQNNQRIFTRKPVKKNTNIVTIFIKGRALKIINPTGNAQNNHPLISIYLKYKKIKKKGVSIGKAAKKTIIKNLAAPYLDMDKKMRSLTASGTKSL
ncbi:hypothetical protein C4J81_17100 [Deltaproteobacteria bacterium Smac51]|nr:hypothetical protein C4J81_17100 [Deltaproteobacteria bacterium Smac51]